MLAQYVLCSPVCVHLSVCLTVRLSITSRHGAKMAKHRITQTTPHISPRHSILLKFEGVTPTWAPITLLTTTYEVTFCSHCFLTVELTVMHCAISDMTSYYPADSIHQLTPILWLDNFLKTVTDCDFTLACIVFLLFLYFSVCHVAAVCQTS